MIAAAGAALLHPLLRRLEPERAHRLTVAGLRLLPAPRPAPDDPRLAVDAFGLRFPNPVGVAAGFDKDAAVPDALLSLGLGFAEVGTLTPLPQPGNARPRVFRLPADAALVNRYGFNNPGHAAALARLVARDRAGGIVGVNIGANKDTADRAADYVAGVAAFARVADYLAVNVSSPNTPGLRDLQAAAALDDLLARVLEARDRAARHDHEPRRDGGPPRIPVLLKIAPDLDELALDDVVRVARARDVDGLIVSNTTLARPPSLRESDAARETGGLSGRPLFAASTRVLAQAYLRVDGQFPLVGVGGVEDAGTALAKIRAGATLVQLYTALVFKGPRLLGEIKGGLAAALADAGTVLSAEVGRDAARAAAG